VTYVPVLGKKWKAHEREREMGRGAGKEGIRANEKEMMKKKKSQSLKCV